VALIIPPPQVKHCANIRKLIAHWQLIKLLKVDILTDNSLVMHSIIIIRPFYTYLTGVVTIAQPFKRKSNDGLGYHNCPNLYYLASTYSNYNFEIIYEHSNKNYASQGTIRLKFIPAILWIVFAQCDELPR